MIVVIIIIEILIIYLIYNSNVAVYEFKPSSRA
jgi:hypothetical protein